MLPTATRLPSSWTALQVFTALAESVRQGAVGMADALADGDPSVRALAHGDDLLLCVETVSSSEIDEIAAAMSAHCQN